MEFITSQYLSRSVDRLSTHLVADHYPHRVPRLYSNQQQNHCLMYVRQNAARHRKSCVRGVIFCSECNYCNYNQQEMNSHTSKKHVKSIPKSKKCVSREKKFPNVSSLSTRNPFDNVVEAKKSLVILSHTIHTLLTLGLTLRAFCWYVNSFLAGCNYNNYIPSKK